ncbi:urea ABC transporter ATP-binding subunit UrtE [Haloferula sp. BvORR071]|uniref:urea ABC transporter ATP-binding subunit UrtE n=1 Tax=Haloferula sp. BvORR071 TaxID=1396141 RepID=UPI0006970182|nr:urea ABC transporter ATP-binding subunit UrtE [Haloferula sp. BvORR071]
MSAVAIEATTLEVRGIKVAIGGSQILRGVDLDIRPKTVFCLMGRNGVGKTTTLKAITGLMDTNAGHVKLLGEEISRFSPEKRALKGIGFVPQGREIFPQLTVEENLHVGTIARGRKPKKEELDRVFTLFPIIKEFLPRKGGMLSGGQQQQLAIGRALLTRPKLLILDEPTEGIQPNIIDQIGDAIKMLRDEGAMAILLVEQYLDFCKELGDDFAILERGRVAADGPMSGLSDELIKEFLTV